MFRICVFLGSLLLFVQLKYIWIGAGAGVASQIEEKHLANGYPDEGYEKTDTSSFILIAGCGLELPLGDHLALRASLYSKNVFTISADAGLAIRF